MIATMAESISSHEQIIEVAAEERPYLLAIFQIRSLVRRHTTQNSTSNIDFISNAETIHQIAQIVDELERVHPSVLTSNIPIAIEEEEVPSSIARMLPKPLSPEISMTCDELCETTQPEYFEPRSHSIPDIQMVEDDSTTLSPGNPLLSTKQILSEPLRPEILMISDESSKRTHPEDFQPYSHHIRDIKVFENDIMKAYQNSNKAQRKYNKVEVLLLTWEPGLRDDIRYEVDRDTAALKDLFQEVNYNVTSIAISQDSGRCWYKLSTDLLSFIDKYRSYPKDDVLFLVHYNGHGSVRNKSSLWHPNGFAARPCEPSKRDSWPNGPTIEYDEVRKLFDLVVKQDILFVLDCCFAGAASRSKGPTNINELLAACGSENRTPVENSFTLNFVNCFRSELKANPVFQVGWLFGVMADISQNPTPLHVSLNKSRESISLSSLASTTPESTALADIPVRDFLEFGDDRSRRPSTVASTEAGSVFSGESSVDLTGPTSSYLNGDPPEHWHYEVLIAVKLHGDIIPERNGWNFEFPASQVDSIRAVKVRSVYLTKSTLLLVTMPVRCWILLPENPAYTFIDFVRSYDLLHSHTVPESWSTLVPDRVSDAMQKESDSAEFHAEYIRYIIAAIKEFENDNKHDGQGKPDPVHRITQKFGLHSAVLPSKSDPRYSYVGHLIQGLVVVDDQHNGSRISYDVHFTQEKKLFERCKKTLIDEVVYNAPADDKEKLETAVTQELEKLKREVLELVEVDKKLPELQAKSIRIKKQGTIDDIKKGHPPKVKSSMYAEFPPMLIPEIPSESKRSSKPEGRKSHAPRTTSAPSTSGIKGFDSQDSRRHTSSYDTRSRLSFLGKRF